MTEDSLWRIVSMEGEKNFISFLSYLMSISFVTQFFCFYHYLPILPSTMLYVVASFNCKTGISEKMLTKYICNIVLQIFMKSFHKRYGNKILHIRQQSFWWYYRTTKSTRILRFIQILKISHELKPPDWMILSSEYISKLLCHIFWYILLFYVKYSHALFHVLYTPIRLAAAAVIEWMYTRF